MRKYLNILELYYTFRRVTNCRIKNVREKYNDLELVREIEIVPRSARHSSCNGGLLHIWHATLYCALRHDVGVREILRSIILNIPDEYRRFLPRYNNA